MDYFALVAADQFTMTVYSRILVDFKKDASDTAYSTAYEKKVATGQSALEKSLKDRPKERVTEVRNDAQEQLAEAKAQVESGQKALDDGAAQLEEAKQKLTEGKAEIANNRNLLQQKISEGQASLDQAKAELNQQAQELATQKATLETSRQPVSYTHLTLPTTSRV